MAAFTRRELKRDEFRSAFEEYEQFVKEHWHEIVTVVGLVIAIGGSAAGLKLYADRQQAEANAALGAALKTFRAYVGTAAPGTPGAEESYATAQGKYQKALSEFQEVVRKYPRQNAAAIARYHIGICQAELGESQAAIQTLQEAGRASDRGIASLAQMALAGVFAKSGKLDQAVKIYQDLAAHPTLTVPRFSALLGLAEAYRDTQPPQARRVYEQLEKEFAADSMLAQAVRQRMTSLPN